MTSSFPPEVDPSERELLTTEQVIDRLLACPQLRRVSATCVLPAIKVNDEWRFSRKELEAWILNHSGQSRR